MFRAGALIRLGLFILNFIRTWVMYSYRSLNLVRVKLVYYMSTYITKYDGIIVYDTPP